MEQTNPEQIREVRKSCRQFAMLYYHFCSVLRHKLGEEYALDTVREAIFRLSCDRAEGLRAEAERQGLPLTPESFTRVTDIPMSGWTEACGGLFCPYADTWVGYCARAPWFRRFASLYCDVIDTTNIEVFSGTTSHRITENLLWGDARCSREYFPSADVAEGKLTYGKR